MDDSRFDAFTRTLSSRRTALGGLLGGVAALLGLDQPEEAAAHNYVARCRRKRDPVVRHWCLRQARNHNRRHRTCRSITLAEACRNVDCGVVTDGCGRRRDCGWCASVHACLSNNGCAYYCGSAVPCPPGCICSGEPECALCPQICLNRTDPNLLCDANPPWYCTHTADCPIGYKCEPVPCGPGGAMERRCVATCA
jgi:hypothetical protein